MTEQASQEIQVQVQHLYDTAHQAAADYAQFDLEAVERITTAAVKAATDKAAYYADWAVKETGFGNVEDKTNKNLLCSANVLKTNTVADYVEPQIDEQQKLIRFPKPAGVVVALVPSTNPVATVYYKSIISLMTRNAVILCPHPGAKSCCADAAHHLADAAEKAGAPKGLIQVIEEPSIPLVDALMKSDRNNLTLATGGPGMVRAAYSASNPAIGVGPGNVACYVHESADVTVAAASTVASKSFDNSVPCTCESVVLADDPIADALWQALGENGAATIESSEEESKLRDLLFPEGRVNPAVIGKSAQWIAQEAGVEIPSTAKVIVMKFDAIGYEEPLSKEKMFPVLGFKRVNDEAEARESALAMLEMMGAGHSAVIYANNPAVVIRYSNALPVCRVAVNSPGALGSAGFINNLNAGPIIGTGFFGRSSIDENVAPKHLIQWTQAAYASDSEQPLGNIAEALGE